MKRLIGGLGALLLPATALAETTPTTALPEALAPTANLIDITVNLVLVLAAVVILAWLFKRVQGFGQPAAGSLRVTATLPLGPKERILLLQAGDQQIVVGASPAGLTTLHVLDAPLPELPAAEPAAEEPGSFRARLQKALGGVRQ